MQISRFQPFRYLHLLRPIRVCRWTISLKVKNKEKNKTRISTTLEHVLIARWPRESKKQIVINSSWVGQEILTTQIRDKCREHFFFRKAPPRTGTQIRLIQCREFSVESSAILQLSGYRTFALIRLESRRMSKVPDLGLLFNIFNLLYLRKMMQYKHWFHHVANEWCWEYLLEFGIQKQNLKKNGKLVF